MAFADGTLVKISGHANSTLGNHWQYTEDAAVAGLDASGYLNDAADVLQLNDVIWLHGNNGVIVGRISSDTGATPVTVAALTAVG